MNTIRKSLTDLTTLFMNECSMMEEISLYGPSANEERLPLLSINIQNLAPADIASTLDKEFGIMVRPGLHCSPLAHQTIGTFPQGTLRFSFGCFTTEEEIRYTLDSLKTIIHQQ
jgi:selenocysteine lyase/cysteine desulfurase